MGFSRQEYWSGLPFPHPGDLPHSGIKRLSLKFPALAGGSLPRAPLGKPRIIDIYMQKKGIGPFLTSMKIPEKLNYHMIQSSYLRYISKRSKISNSKRSLNYHVHNIIIYSNQNTELTQMSIAKWMDWKNKKVLYTCNGILFSDKERKSCYLGQHGWTWKILCWMKQTRHWKPNYAWSHLVESKIIKTISTECEMVVAGGWRKWGNVGQREKKF